MFSFSKIFKYIWPQIRKHKGAFLGIIFFFGVRVFIDFIIIPIYFKKFIDLLSTSGLDRTILSTQIFYIVFWMMAFHFLVAFTARTRGFLYIGFMVNMIRDLRNFTFQKIEQNSQTFFANTFAGSLVTKSRRFVFGFENMFDIFLFNFLQIAVLLVGAFVVLMRESLFIGSVLFGFVFVYMLTVLFLVKRKFNSDILEAEQDSRISGRLADIFGNISAVKFFSARKHEISYFGKYVDEGANRSRQAMKWGNRIDVLQSFFSFVIGAVILYILTRFWIDGKISTGTVVLVETYLTMILVRLWDLSGSLVRFMKSAADMKEVVDIFETAPDILDPKNPEISKMTEGHIVFKNVSFKYQMGEEVLTDFNLDIKPSERVGVVGHSGAGKSTITKLLLRFNDITSGSITIDGQDIRNVTQDDLRKSISYVPQEPILFHRPIKENINYGKPYATEQEIIEVSKKAHADEFISKLSKGYETMVGERGVKLSGGERQRVAIARAMLKDAPILMLDEATSSLDSISESYIQDAFSELMKGKTTIVIAHRLSTVQKMDRIIVLDKGQIVEEGTHKELLEKDGVYADLWNHQTGGFLE
jgi:ATP-binding cassette subfamily B protein